MISVLSCANAPSTDVHTIEFSDSMPVQQEKTSFTYQPAWT